MERRERMKKTRAHAHSHTQRSLTFILSHWVCIFNVDGSFDACVCCSLCLILIWCMLASSCVCEIRAKGQMCAFHTCFSSTVQAAMTILFALLCYRISIVGVFSNKVSKLSSLHKIKRLIEYKWTNDPLFSYFSDFGQDCVLNIFILRKA